MKKISVIIPVYNRAQYVDSCLKSVISQTIGLESLEIIIINDGSTDNSLDILKEYDRIHESIVLIDQVNQGVSAARNAGLKHATGEYIAFLDADDYLPKDAYEVLYNKSNNLDIVLGKFQYIDEDGTVKHTAFENVFKNTKADEIVIDPRIDEDFWHVFRYGSLWFRIFKTNFIQDKKLVFVDILSSGGDLYFTTLATLLAKNVKLINHVVYCYIQAPDSIMRGGMKSKTLFYNIFKVFECTYAGIQTYGLCKYKHIFDYMVLDNHLPFRNRIVEFSTRSCIDLYDLISHEFNYIASIIKNILENTSKETFARLSSERYSVYKNLHLNNENIWSYYQKPGKQVSIIVPFYNVEKYIRACLESLEQQTLKEIEVILIDDGSPDDSIEIANEFIEKNTNFFLFRKENGGQGSARNLGLKHAKGEYILFLDSDDMLPPRACEVMYNKAVETGSCIVVGESVWKYEDRTEDVAYLKKWFNSDEYENLRENHNFPLSCVIVTAKLFRRSLIYDNNLEFLHIIGEDIPFALQSWYYAKKIAITNNIVYWRTERQDENNKSTMQTFNAETVKDRLIGMKFMEVFCADKKLTDIRTRMFSFFHGIIHRYFKNITDDTEKEKAYEFIKIYISSFSDKADLQIISRYIGFDAKQVEALPYSEYVMTFVEA